TSIPVPSPAAGVIAERYVEDGSTVKAGQKIFKITVGEIYVINTDVCRSGAAGSAPQKPKPSSVEKPKEIPQQSVPETKPTQMKAPEIIQPAKPSIIDPAPPPLPVKGPMTSMPVAAIKHAQALEAATVKVPPEDPTKEISGTRTEFRVKMNRMRQRIAQRLKEAQNINAMLTTFNEIDMSAIIEFRKTHQEPFLKKHGVKLGFMSAFVKAAAYALQDQPVVNAVIADNEIIYRDYIDISVAVATPKGLVVPVIRNVESMTYADIEKSINALGERARLGKLAVEDMDGGTFTISNGGVFGSLMGTPIINPPQSAILGMHATFERPVAIKGQVVIRPMMYVALTYDHRLIDGREAVLFLRKIKAAVEDPRIIVAGL
ncbi:hypothetical protein AAG570_008054, partial [Ranatra chinensis]